MVTPLTSTTYVNCVVLPFTAFRLKLTLRPLTVPLDKVHVAANLAETARGNSEREIVDSKRDRLVREIYAASVYSQSEIALLMEALWADVESMN
jgi:hypothetical protein